MNRKTTFRNAAFLLLASLCLLSLKKKDQTWVAIGDSITYLNDHTDETGNRVTKGYLSLVTEKMPGLRYVNQGHNGWTASGIAEKIDSLGIVPADLYTVFLGTNDWWHGGPLGNLNDYKNKTGIGTVYGSFRIIIDKIRSLNPAAKIILITPMQRADFVYVGNMKNHAYGSYKPKDGQTLESFTAALDSIGALESIPVVDLYHNSQLSLKHLVHFKWLKDPSTGKYRKYKYPAAAAIPFNPDTDQYPYPPAAADETYDGLHPSDKGNAVIAKVLVGEFRKAGF